MKLPIITTDYREDENTSTAYKGEFCVASLNFNTDAFEVLEDMSEEDADYYYNLMIIEREYEPAHENN